MRKPVMAALVGPPDTDKIVKNGKICKLTVVTSKENAGSYFPLGFEMIAADLAVAYAFCNTRDAEALDELRNRGSVLMVSEAKLVKEHTYAFNGFMIAFSSTGVGDSYWHVVTGAYPPLVLEKEFLYHYPELLVLLESVLSGGGLSLLGVKLYPMKLERNSAPMKKNEVVKPSIKMSEAEFHVGAPFILLGSLASWRASRASRKKTDGRSEDSRES